VSTQPVPHKVVPAEHPVAQLPCAHTLPVAQAWSQVPQFEALVRTSTHVPPQSTMPIGQVQDPARHSFPPVHAMPHDPQLPAFVRTSTHDPLHDIEPSGQDVAHLPLLHTSPGLQAIEHPPQ
jgi:hypothetical protein